jgi:hypothetical protein
MTELLIKIKSGITGKMEMIFGRKSSVPIMRATFSGTKSGMVGTAKMFSGCKKKASVPLGFYCINIDW